eukprot:gene33287-41078_t
MSKRIGVIGSGCIGAEVVRKFRRAGHPVWVANSRGPESLKDLALETGATASTVDEILQTVDVVIVTIVEKNVPDLAEAFHKHRSRLLSKVIVVETGNYYPDRDGVIPELENNESQSAWVSKHLGVPVLKLFNHIYFESFTKGELPAGHPERIALCLAGENEEHKAVITGLVDSIGFD